MGLANVLDDLRSESREELKESVLSLLRDEVSSIKEQAKSELMGTCKEAALEEARKELAETERHMRMQYETRLANEVEANLRLVDSMVEAKVETERAKLRDEFREKNEALRDERDKAIAERDELSNALAELIAAIFMGGTDNRIYPGRPSLKIPVWNLYLLNRLLEPRGAEIVGKHYEDSGCDVAAIVDDSGAPVAMTRLRLVKKDEADQRQAM